MPWVGTEALCGEERSAPMWEDKREDSLVVGGRADTDNLVWLGEREH